VANGKTLLDIAAQGTFTPLLIVSFMHRHRQPPKKLALPASKEKLMYISKMAISNKY